MSHEGADQVSGGSSHNLGNRVFLIAVVVNMVVMAMGVLEMRCWMRLRLLWFGFLVAKSDFGSHNG